MYSIIVYSICVYSICVYSIWVYSIVCIAYMRVYSIYYSIFCLLQAPYVAGQLDHCLARPDKYTAVLLGFNPVEMAR